MDVELSIVNRYNNATQEANLSCGGNINFSAIQPTDVIIDLGCGTGNETIRAAQIAIRGTAYGIDITPKMVDTARERALALGVTNIKFILGSLDSLPFDHDFADLVISNCAINHVKDKEREYREIFRVLKDHSEGISVDQPELTNYLVSRGYLFESKEQEDRLIQEKLAEFQNALNESAPQVLIIPTYSCNLDCIYCFQKGIKHKTQIITSETVDAFYKLLPELYPFQKPFITLFGGEPLINSPKQREIIDYIVKTAASSGYEIAAVTNGYDLLEYLDLLTQANIREIQVTIDGPAVIHDSRRHTSNGKGTYERIIAGLRSAIQLGIPINLRVVADETNFDSLTELAHEFDSLGWLDLPAEKFKTQIGRNYELFDCYAAPSHLLGQVEHWAKVVELSKEHPVLKKFHQPEFKGIKHLVQSGELYLPTFDTCPACKTEWVFDLYGDIYGCTANTGRDDYKLGTFYPELKLDHDQIKIWQQRNVLNIPECKDCDVSLICGGGCGVVAKEKNGRILSPDCRPIKGIIDQGLGYYQCEILKLAEV